MRSESAVLSAIRAGHAMMFARPEHEIVNAFKKRIGG
jgi:hypothetical protein